MGVIAVTEIWENRGMSYSDAFHREYRRTFRVICDTLLISQTYILFHPLIPRLSSVYFVGGYESDPGAICTNVSCDQDTEDPFCWIVKCEYSTQPPVEFQRREFTDTTQPGQAPDPDPLRERPNIRWGTVHDRVVAEYSVTAEMNGPLLNPTATGGESDIGSWILDEVASQISQYHTIPARTIQNTAGQQPYPRLEKDASRSTATVTRNEKVFPTDVAKLRDHLNETRFLGYEARQVKLQSVTGEREFKHNKSFWTVQYVFEMREPSWDVILVQQGTMARPDIGAAATQVMVAGLPATSPVFLDDYGRHLPPVDVGGGIMSQRVYYKKHALYPAVDLKSILNFGDLT